MLRMQALSARPRFAEVFNSSWLRTLSVRAFSSSDYGDQSRGGLPRFYSDMLPPSKGNVVRVQGDEFWHMTKVLRLSASDRVELFNGKGGLVEGCIQNIDRTGLDFVALNDPKLIPPQNTQWHVFAGFGTLKGGRADWLVEKCTELGANSVTPLLTERCPSISESRVDRLERVILAASKQCQRLHEMVLKPPIELEDLLHLIAQSKLSLLAAAKATPVLSALTSSSQEASGLIIIGPEGGNLKQCNNDNFEGTLDDELGVGACALASSLLITRLNYFTEKEASMMIEAGATAVGLGQHRLRVETATIALLATVMLWSDSQQSCVC